MDYFVMTLRDEVEEFIGSVQAKETDELHKSAECIGLLEKSFEQLKVFISSYEFRDDKEEICFFKEIKPRLFCYLIFYRELYNIEMNRPKGGNEMQVVYLKQELMNINSFFLENKDFYHYYRRGSTHLDDIYFKRGQKGYDLNLESFYFERDPMFSTNCDFKVAKILSNNLMESYLMKEIGKLENKDSTFLNLNRSKLEWTHPKIDLIELIHALYETGCINYGKKSYQELVSVFEKLFDIELNNASRGSYDLKIREKPAKFLDELKKFLLRRLNKDD